MFDVFFEPSFGNRPRNLVGRDKYLRDFRDALTTRTGSRERSVLIIGQRGYGKTVLLLEMADIARESGYIVASPTVTSSEMTERIIEKLQIEGEEHIKKSKTKITGGNISFLGFGAGIQVQNKEEKTKSFAYRLSELCKEYGKKGYGILLLIDEVQANSEELKQLIIAYQEIVGEGGNIAMVMAGLPSAISTTLNERVLTFLNRARKVDLAPIDTREIYRYFRDVFAQAGINLTDDQCRQAAVLTNGSPYLMQLVGHYIVKYSDEKGKLKPTDYEAALVDSQEDFINDIGKTTLKELSDRDVDFLRAMAVDDGDSSISAIAERMNVSSAYAQLYKRRLVDAGVIEQPRRGIVRITIAFLKEYLRDHPER